jgi:hypothetical protein
VKLFLTENSNYGWRQHGGVWLCLCGCFFMYKNSENQDHRYWLLYKCKRISKLWTFVYLASVRCLKKYCMYFKILLPSILGLSRTNVTHPRSSHGRHFNIIDVRKLKSTNWGMASQTWPSHQVSWRSVSWFSSYYRGHAHGEIIISSDSWWNVSVYVVYS